MPKRKCANQKKIFSDVMGIVIGIIIIILLARAMGFI